VRGGYADASVLGLTGLDRLLAARDGRIPAPPIHHLTGLRPTAAGPGSANFTMPASPWWQSPAGVFTTGVMAWLGDAPLGSAVSTALPPGKVLLTSELSMNFLRPVSVASGSLVGRARLIRAGSRLGLSEVDVTDSRGNLLGHGSSRCFLFEVVSPPLQPPDDLSWTPREFDTPDPYLRPAPGEVLSQEVWDSTSGLDVLRGLIAGDLPAPPCSFLFGGRFSEVTEGSATFTIPATEWLNSPARAIYGGALAYLADMAMAGAVQTTIPRRTAFAPLDLKVNFLRPALADGRDLIARASVIHRGRTLAVATAEIVDAEGRALCVATASAMVVPGRAWPGAMPVVAEDEAAGEGADDA